MERFPAHVVAGWLGHSPLVADRHYLQTRDAHFDLAVGKGEAAANPEHKRAQVIPRANWPNRKTPKSLRIWWGLVPGVTRWKKREVGDTGLEPVTSCVSCMRASQLRQSPGLSAAGPARGSCF